MFKSTKTFGHDFGLTVAFRQHKAKSHCRFIHGYALKVKLTFSTHHLDKHNWVVDFGSFGDVKEYLKDNFDHKLIVADDDPQLDYIAALAGLGAADVRVVKRTGCEAFAESIYNFVRGWLYLKTSGIVHLDSVEVFEHEGNSASYYGEEELE